VLRRSPATDKSLQFDHSTEEMVAIRAIGKRLCHVSVHKEMGPQKAP